MSKKVYYAYYAVMSRDKPWLCTFDNRRLHMTFPKNEMTCIPCLQDTSRGIYSLTDHEHHMLCKLGDVGHMVGIVGVLYVQLSMILENKSHLFSTLYVVK